jgi:hypothetical protein
VGNGVWIAGGSIRKSLFPNTQELILEGDLDFFFKDKESFDRYWNQVIMLPTVKLLNSLTSKNNVHHNIELKIRDFDQTERTLKLSIQLITIAYYETVETLLDSFDFTICQFGFDGTDLYCGDLSLSDLAQKRLAAHRITYPVESMRRLVKYSLQGFFASVGCFNAIAIFIAKNPKSIQEGSGYFEDGTNMSSANIIPFPFLQNS